MTTRRRFTTATVVALATLAVPTFAHATITAVTIRPGTGPGGCADVSAATSTITAQYQLPGGALVAAVTGQPVVATACAGGAGRSITFDVNGNPDFAATDFVIRGNDETTPLTVHIPIGRRDGTTAHFRELTPGSTVGGVLVPGDSYSVSPLPTPTVVTTIGGKTATVALGSLPQVYFYFNARASGSSVQVNNPAPNTPILVELRRPDGVLVLSRTIPAPTPASNSSTNVFDAPGLPPGSTARVAQAPYIDRTRAAPTAEFSADGFRVALPVGAEGGRFSAQLALSPASTNPLDPLGPCETLQTTGALPTPSCAGLTTPRVQVTASGLRPIAGDRVSLGARFPASSDTADYSAIQPGISAEMDGGRIEPVTASRSPFNGTITVPRQAPLDPFVFTRQGIFGGGGEGRGSFSGADAFPIRIVSGSRLRLDGPDFTPPLEATLNLDAAVSGGSVVGTTLPGALVRVTVGDSRSPFVDSVVTAGPNGAFTVALGMSPVGALIRVVSGDAPTRTAVSRQLVVGKPVVRIAGGTDRQLVRGAISLSATAALDVPSWTVGSQEFRLPGATLPIDSTRYADGPLRVGLTESFRSVDYLFLLVDNTSPSGGLGADQGVRPGREATFVTNAADANGLAAVAVDFGDGASVNQAAGVLGQPIVYRYAKAGRYTARVTITDRAGNVTRDDAVVTAAAVTPPKLSGKPPTKIKRGARLRINQTSSAVGTLRVQLVNAKGRIAVRGVANVTKANSKVTVTIATKKIPRGRYLMVRQLVSQDGDTGPLLTSILVIR